MYATINPFNNKIVKTFETEPLPDLGVNESAFRQWKNLNISQRAEQLNKVAELLKDRKSEYASLITLEMGKPLSEAEYEINKTLTTFEYYIKHAEEFLEAELIESNASHSYVSYEPMGIIFSIMPWNFPFWQVFRFAIPTLISGNVTILKHAPSVPQCALAIRQLFIDAGVEKGIFTTHFISNEDASKIIADPRVKGLSFTGSDSTGSLLASQAGKHIKKCVMELGGNDPFIVLADAAIEYTISGAVKSRSINSGQSCNSAKRFLIDESIEKVFVQKLTEAVHALKLGDPTDSATNIGPLARRDLAEKVKKQISNSVSQGANSFVSRQPFPIEGNFVSPVILTGVKPGMTAFEEEIFGPVWSVVTFKSEEEAVTLANQSSYGLGASVWTSDIEKAKKMIPKLEAGNVFINDIVKSDPRLPFGGVKRSGFGRELSKHGLLEFVNIKTVYFH